MILYFLALVFGLHIVMVNLGIAFSTVIPILKRKGEKENNEIYLRTSKQLMNFYAATYGLAGVFGTAFTVFLLSFYPSFIGLAGHLTFHSLWNCNFSYSHTLLRHHSLLVWLG